MDVLHQRPNAAFFQEKVLLVTWQQVIAFEPHTLNKKNFRKGMESGLTKITGK